MSFATDFESAIEYIEENLTGKIDLNMVAKKAKCSPFHFQRMFSSIVGFPLSEYIRRRRLTLAAFDVQNSDERIIDIAMKYGYETHSSFSRAFQSMHGVTPSKVRTEGVVLMAYPPISFQFSLKGAEAMQYRIVETQPFKLFGTDAVQIDGWDPDKFLEHADRVIENGSHDETNIAAGFPGKVREMMANNEWDVSRIHLLHAIHFWDDEGKKYFMYGWELPETGVGEQFTILEVPASAWVVVTIPLNGNRTAITGCYKDLYVNWFPNSGYEQAPGRPVIEKYNDKTAELWMPIAKKQ